MKRFKRTRKLKVGPHSSYYAIQEKREDQQESKNPVMVIVDPEKTPQLVIAENYSKKPYLSAIIVPDLSIIDKLFSRQILDVVDENSVVNLYKIPLVAKHRGNVENNSEIIKVF